MNGQPKVHTNGWIGMSAAIVHLTRTIDDVIPCHAIQTLFSYRFLFFLAASDLVFEI